MNVPSSFKIKTNSAIRYSPSTHVNHVFSSLVLLIVISIRSTLDKFLFPSYISDTDKYSLNAFWFKLNKNILSCFSGIIDRFNIDIVMNDDVIIYI